MKVLHLGKYYPPVFGGIENVNYELVEALNEAGVETDVIALNNSNKTVVENVNGYTVHRQSSIFKVASTSVSFSYIRKLISLRNEYDVISVHCPNPIAFLAIFFARPNCKLVLHWHSDVIKQKVLGWFFKPLQNWIVNKSDVVLGATDAHIEGSDISHHFINKSKKLTYIFQKESLSKSIDFAKLQSLKSQFEGKKIIFSVGRLVYYKGFDVLIESMSYVDDKDIILVIAGKGELDSKLRNKVSDLNLMDRVFFAGGVSQSELAAYYELCDVFCLPSVHRSEMFGIVQLEAMSFGKPVISTKLDRSGVPLVNVDGSTGKTVEPFNSQELALAITNTLTDVDFYERCSKNALQHLENFERKKVVKDLITIYDNI
ncbi:rhamnosyl/mannosyltransferase [Ferrimonas sediminum]|uniref:Rhamnosyl/mannosyltransferase n=1 Tax=Ferrimonas sediminum TaxID=718193 RepID=A0A1G8Z1K9_9GAMM|nr:glycosyltransferase [Ferrimonas sediminum]SDK08524.1 rhamnosyl/mannosyltransferase [Ferrimonas sediminum]